MFKFAFSLTFVDAFWIITNNLVVLVLENFLQIKMNPAFSQMAGAIAAQNRILQHFLKSGFEVKQGNRNLNYIEFRNLGSVKAKALEIPADTIQGKNVPAEERVLVLMHGYGLGLAFFFANYDALLVGFTTTTTTI